MMGDSQGLRNANLKILGHGEVWWNFFEIRPFEKGRSLILRALMGLRRSRSQRPLGVINATDH